ncbi:hypothetical protein M408DRAFT_147280 [Serendipita vermifera MAFF 305830]|uniref:F-box domain-containing protein n=1 Tax=Serendipita vermifera MAFF 305830 TaxID=933852 RepID=A0A0C2XG15_SERVB|nr:hypothetical protein M408DRAFT_147280 [Serendipita vermifera MAFF 305830]
MTAITAPRAFTHTFDSPEPSEPNRYIPPLPVELWTRILSFVEGADDKYSLSQVSNMLRILVVSFLGTIQLSPLENVPNLAPRGHPYPLLIFMQDTQRATIVTSLHVKLSCLRTSYLPQGHMEGKHCTKLDNALGGALHYMVNLKNLHIDYHFCIAYQRHRYLAHLVAPQLRDLSVVCGCGMSPALSYTKWNKFPIFDTVETLGWSSLPSRPGVIPYNPGTFTKLKALEYHGREAECSLLAMRPIERLLVALGTPVYDPLFIAALIKSPGALTHLIFQSFSKITQMVPPLSSYLDKLQHVGTLPDFNHPIDAIRAIAGSIQSYLTALASLPCLVSLDACVESGSTRWNHNMLILVNKSLPNIRRVMVRSHRCCVWERRDRIWEKREVESFSDWDIIRGACDTI